MHLHLLLLLIIAAIAVAILMDDGYEQAAKTNRPTRVRPVGSVDAADTRPRSMSLAPFFLSTRAFTHQENEGRRAESLDTGSLSLSFSPRLTVFLYANPLLNSMLP